MSSIIYTADQDMMEYHRLNGSRTINFWRPSSQYAIKGLHKGDFVFFYSKMLYGNAWVKGIVGYGRYERSYFQTFDRMWSQFHEMNGAQSKEQLKESIMRYAPEERKKIQSLYIDDVLFFNQPVLLSQLSTPFNPNIESYVYCSKKDDTDGTFEILEKAQEVGINLWAAAMNNQPMDEHQFERDLAYARACKMHRMIGDFPYNGVDGKRNAQLAKKYFDSEPTRHAMDDSLYEYIDVQNDRVDVYLPLAVKMRNSDSLKTAMGHLMLWKHLLTTDFENGTIHCYVDETFGVELSKWIADPIVQVEVVKVD